MPGLSVPCAALPEVFSEAMRIRLTQHDYERPEAMARWDLVSEQRACPVDELPAYLRYTPPRCVRIPSAQMEALYLALRRGGLASFRVRPLAPTAHRGGHTIEVAWAGGECSVSAVSGESEIARDDAAGFSAAVGTIADVIRDAE